MTKEAVKFDFKKAMLEVTTSTYIIKPTTVKKVNK